MPDTVAFLGGNLSIPVVITDVVELLALDLTVQYDETVLTVISTSFENTQLDGMNFITQTPDSPTPDEIRVLAYSSGSTFSGSGNLLFINFDVIGQLSESTSLIFRSIEVNEPDEDLGGMISLLENAQNGSVTIHQSGCMDEAACNYDVSAEYNDGSCAYELDCFGVCGGDAIVDCAGLCDGTSLVDECDTCGGDGIAEGTCDCDGNIDLGCGCGADAPDECGTCDPDFPNDCVQDCTYVWGGNGCFQQDCEIYPSETYNCEGLLLSNSNSLPFEFELLPNYPNPFNPTTTINYSISIFSVVNISIYSINGELIQTLVNSSKQPGEYAIQWNASIFPSGLYFVKLISSNKIAEQRVLLIK